METLKKMMLACFMVVSIQAKAQNFETIKTAFSNSYAQETDAKYSEAIKTMLSVYEVTSYEINLRIAYLYYLDGQYSTSISYYQKAIDLRPMSIEARLGYALPASALGNWDKVKEKYLEILKLDPNNSTTNYRMGLICYYSADYENACKYFEKVLNLYPFDYDTLLAYAWAKLKMGNTSEAKTLFHKVLYYNPSDESALEGLGLIK